jgi:TetR/AcrR family transcriptional regulator, transcriptional repressor for nem operon
MARPKEFDRDAVLDRAVDVFWARGYEATSIGELTDALGIGRQSLYDTFGDKHALYLAALDRYREQTGGITCRALGAEVPVRRAMRRLLQAIIDTILGEPGRTCMMVNAAAERCPLDAAVARRFAAAASTMSETIEARLSRARDDGELGTQHDPVALARYFVNAIHGLNITAKAVRDRRALEQIADVTVSILG